MNALVIFQYKFFIVPLDMQYAQRICKIDTQMNTIVRLVIKTLVINVKNTTKNE